MSQPSNEALQIAQAIQSELGASASSEWQYLATVFAKVANGSIPPEQAQKEIETNQGYLSILAALQGRTISTKGTVLTFGSENQMGDVSVRDVIGGNSFHLTVNYTVQTPHQISLGSPDKREASTLTLKQSFLKKTWTIWLLLLFIVSVIADFGGAFSALQSLLNSFYSSQTEVPVPSATANAPKDEDSSPMAVETDVVAANTATLSPIDANSNVSTPALEPLPTFPPPTIPMEGTTPDIKPQNGTLDKCIAKISAANGTQVYTQEYPYSSASQKRSVPAGQLVTIKERSMDDKNNPWYLIIDDTGLVLGWLGPGDLEFQVPCE